MIRMVIKIDPELCDGCGICVEACHECAIGLVDGKARLLRDDYCDGLGDCLPACPTGAISFEEREAAPYDEAAVNANMQKHQAQSEKVQQPVSRTQSETLSKLAQWPIQIKLMPIQAQYFDKADLLIAADCAAFAYADFHAQFMENRVTIVGCPKLDAVDYSEKLEQIIRQNDIKSIVVVRMQVPCCGGIEQAAARALHNSGKNLPLEVVTLSVEGQIL